MLLHKPFLGIPTLRSAFQRKAKSLGQVKTTRKIQDQPQLILEKETLYPPKYSKPGLQSQHLGGRRINTTSGPVGTSVRHCRKIGNKTTNQSEQTKGSTVFRSDLHRHKRPKYEGKVIKLIENFYESTFNLHIR